MIRTIITTRTNANQPTSKGCMEARILTSGIIWCNVGNTQCTFLQCTEKNDKINVKVIK